MEGEIKQHLDIYELISTEYIEPILECLRDVRSELDKGKVPPIPSDYMQEMVLKVHQQMNLTMNLHHQLHPERDDSNPPICDINQACEEFEETIIKLNARTVELDAVPPDATRQQLIDGMAAIVDAFSSTTEAVKLITKLLVKMLEDCMQELK